MQRFFGDAESKATSRSLLIGLGGSHVLTFGCELDLHADIECSIWGQHRISEEFRLSTGAASLGCLECGYHRVCDVSC